MSETKEELTPDLSKLVKEKIITRDQAMGMMEHQLVQLGVLVVVMMVKGLMILLMLMMKFK